MSCETSLLCCEVSSAFRLSWNASPDIEKLITNLVEQLSEAGGDFPARPVYLSNFVHILSRFAHS